MRLLDLFCCQGGAGAGYHLAGFEVIGVDVEPQPRYPFRFLRRDALDFVRRYGQRFDAIHASPPCQAYTNAQKLRSNNHPDLIGPVREILARIGVPYVIENVPGAPLRADLILCGGAFGLKTYRHRVFESNVPLVSPGHPPHKSPVAKMGRPPKSHEFMHVVGNFSNIERARQAMGITWMNRDGLREAVPPAYTQYIGEQLIQTLKERKA